MSQNDLNLPHLWKSTCRRWKSVLTCMGEEVEERVDAEEEEEAGIRGADGLVEDPGKLEDGLEGMPAEEGCCGCTVG